MEKEYKVFCCTHIDTECFNDPLYTLLHTGADYDGKKYKNMLADNTGDNISNKKDKFDGLVTGLYWIWKNTNYEITGICSYRGYMSYDGKKPIGLNETKELFENKQIDFIAARAEVPMSIYATTKKYEAEIFARNMHNPFEYLREAVEYVDPAYLNAFDHVMYKGSILNCRHTFIARRKYFAHYCEWIFNVMTKYDQILKEKHYQFSGYRFYGGIIEIMERVWIINNPINVLELPIIMITEQNVGYIN